MDVSGAHPEMDAEYDCPRKAICEQRARLLMEMHDSRTREWAVLICVSTVCFCVALLLVLQYHAAMCGKPFIINPQVVDICVWGIAAVVIYGFGKPAFKKFLGGDK